MSIESAKSIPSTEPVIAMMRGELSSGRRWVYRALLAFDAVMLAMVVSLWLTEPRPLPTRLHIAFAAMTSLAVGWIVLLAWILTRKYCPTAIDRIATAWMGVLGSALFLVVGIGISVARSDSGAAMAIAASGIVFVTAAALLLRNAYAERNRLIAKMRELSDRRTQ